MGESLSRSQVFIRRIDAMVERHRGRPDGPTSEEVEKLYTDGCALALTLERERLRTKRQLTSVRLDREHSSASELTRLEETLSDDLKRLRAELDHLRTALEWLELGQAGPRPRILETRLSR